MAVVNRANPKRRGGTSGWKEIRYRGQCLDDWRKQLSEGSDGRHAIEDPDLAAVAVAGGWPAAVQQLQAQQLLQPEPPCPQLPSLGPPWLPPWLPLGTRTPATPAADHGMGGDLAGPVSLTPVGSQRSASLLPLPAGPADRQQQQGDPLQQQAQPAAASPPAAGLQAAPALQAPQQPGTPPIGDSAVAAAVLAELSAELGQACQQEEAQAAGIWPQLCSGFQAG